MEFTDNEIWVFLSHSNKDYEKVRKVRDILEEQQLRPLMFFLKCLNDDEEIDSLIKREIRCRTRFILCDSKKARNSKWVKREVEFIKSLDRECETVNLEDSIEDIRKQLFEFKKRTSLYISYTRKDQQLAYDIANRLKKYEFKVWIDLANDFIDENYEHVIKHEIRSCISSGFVVALLNENQFVEGNWSREELKIALYESKKFRNPCILPVYLNRDIELSIRGDKDLHELSSIDAVSASGISIEQRSDFIVNAILQTLLQPGTILSYARKYANGEHCAVDKEEADKLFKLFYELADRASKYSPTAEGALGLCYEFGYGTEINLNLARDYYRDVMNEVPAYKENYQRVIEKIKDSIK